MKCLFPFKKAFFKGLKMVEISPNMTEWKARSPHHVIWPIVKTTTCVFKHVVFYSLINSTELNIQHPLQNKNRLLSCECQREKQYLQ